MPRSSRRLTMLGLLVSSSGFDSGACSAGMCPMTCSSAVSRERRVGLRMASLLWIRRYYGSPEAKVLFLRPSHWLDELYARCTNHHVIVGPTAANQSPELRLDVRRRRAIRKDFKLQTTGAHQTHSAVRVSHEGGDGDHLLQQLHHFQHSN